MTKDEACDAIGVVRNHRYRDGTWTAIRKILDQIGPEPGAFTVRELCELMAHSPEAVLTQLCDDQQWLVNCANLPNITGHGIDELKAKLIELATPPKTKTVMVELDLATAKCIAEYRDGELAKSCRNALNKLEQQQAK